MQPWNTARATIYGAAIGIGAAAFKLFAPWAEPHDLAAIAREFVGAGLAFALLCAAAAALRNYIARRLIWPEIQWARAARVAAASPAANKSGAARCAAPRFLSEAHYIFVISTSLVSGRKISATTKLIAAIEIGYQRPE